MNAKNIIFNFEMQSTFEHLWIKKQSFFTPEYTVFVFNYNTINTLSDVAYLRGFEVVAINKLVSCKKSVNAVCLDKLATHFY